MLNYYQYSFFFYNTFEVIINEVILNLVVVLWKAMDGSIPCACTYIHSLRLSPVDYQWSDSFSDWEEVSNVWTHFLKSYEVKSHFL